MVWNGEPLMQRDRINEWLTQKVPKTSHTITYCDAQRVIGEMLLLLIWKLFVSSQPIIAKAARL